MKKRLCFSYLKSACSCVCVCVCVCACKRLSVESKQVKWFGYKKEKEDCRGLKRRCWLFYRQQLVAFRSPPVHCTSTSRNHFFSVLFIFTYVFLSYFLLLFLSLFPIFFIFVHMLKHHVKLYL